MASVVHDTVRATPDDGDDLVATIKNLSFFGALNRHVRCYLTLKYKNS